jgi:hypothetical protein
MSIRCKAILETLLRISCSLAMAPPPELYTATAVSRGKDRSTSIRLRHACHGDSLAANRRKRTRRCGRAPTRATRLQHGGKARWTAFAALVSGLRRRSHCSSSIRASCRWIVAWLASLQGARSRPDGEPQRDRRATVTLGESRPHEAAWIRHLRRIHAPASLSYPVNTTPTHAGGTLRQHTLTGHHFRYQTTKPERRMYR